MSRRSPRSAKPRRGLPLWSSLLPRFSVLVSGLGTRGSEGRWSPEPQLEANSNGQLPLSTADFPSPSPSPEPRAPSPPALHALEDPCRAHAAADAHRDQAVSRVPPPHLVEARRRQLGAGAAERVAKRNRAAVDVETIGIDGQLAQAGDHLRGEGLVQLDEIHVVEREPGDL